MGFHPVPSFLEAQRTQPCRDLVRRVELESPATIADLGCGPGNSTAELQKRWPTAKIIGIDNSPDMLERARADYSGIEWVTADIATWTPPKKSTSSSRTPPSSGSPATASSSPTLLSHAAPGGYLAIQIPANIDALPHRLMQELAASPRLASTTSHTKSANGDALEPAAYYDILAPHSATLDIWSTTYLHVLPDPAAIVEWYKGTGLRSWLDALPGEKEKEKFLTDYTARIAQYFHPKTRRKSSLSFERLFLLASPKNNPQKLLHPRIPVGTLSPPYPRSRSSID